MDFRLSIEDIFSLVTTNGDVKSYIIEGPMGSGKSSLVELAKDRFGEGAYNYCTVDCTQLDVGDINIPDVDKEARVVRYLPNVLLVGDGTKPVMVNLDEFGKASRSVQNALLPVLLEHRVGAVKLPAGSVVFGCTNLGAEGVGDLFQPHARNRVSFIQMRHPTNEEWIQWAMPRGVHPAMLAWAKENPQLFHSFEEHPNPDTNPHIFHPKEQRRSFVTPRSLYLASIELQEDRRSKINNRNATLAAIAGNIGTRAALDLHAFVELADKLPSWDSIVKAPESALLMDNSPAAMILTVFSCVSRVEKHTLDAVMTYVQRLPTEVQCMFAIQLVRVPSKAGWVGMNSNFTAWVRQNGWKLVK
jgi:hypothetical protein